MAHSLSRSLLALSAGLVLLTSSLPAAFAQDRMPGVAGPSPLDQGPDPAAPYRAAMAGLEKLGVDRQQADALWPRLDSLADLTRQELDFLLLPNARTGLLSRYLDYARTAPELTQEEVVETVNIGLDRDFYTDTALAEDPDSLTTLVNKYQVLPADYIPELEVLGPAYGRGSLRPEAAAQFRAMADSARSDGISLRSVSAYRSYNTQANLYRNYCAQYRQSVVDTFSARAGSSEHQTGLALDINVARTSAHFENTAEYAWLQANCARFGFLLRYPQGKEHITGYRFEPWHYRYVGVEIAQTCMEQGLAYEEYLARLPAEEAASVPALTLDGTGLDLGNGALALEGTLYLSPARLAQALGWPLEQNGAAATFPLEGRTFTFLPGRTGLQDGRLLRLATPALELNGTVYMTVEDLAAALNWTAVKTGTGWSLVYRSRN